MGGFGSFIAGAGQPLLQLGNEERQRRFQLQHQGVQIAHENATRLSQTIQNAIGMYPEDLQDRLKDVQIQLDHLANPTQQDLDKVLQSYLRAKQDTNKDWIAHPDNPVNKAKGTPAVQAAVNAARGNPAPTPAPATQGGGGNMLQLPWRPPGGSMAGMIGQPQAPSSAPMAAQPGLSPVSPQAQGGGNSSPAAFRQPAATAGADAGQPSVPGAGSPAPQTLGNIEGIEPIKMEAGASAAAPLVNLDDLMARHIYGSMKTGIIGPDLRDLIQKQAGTNAAIEQASRMGGVAADLGKHKLQMLDDAGILKDLPPYMRSSIRSQTLTGVQSPSMQGLGIPKLISPGVLGEDAPPGALEIGSGDPLKKGVLYRIEYIPGTEQLFGTALKPNIGTETTAEGGRATFNRNTGERAADLTGAVSPSMLGTSSSSTVTSPGAAPVTTSTVRKKVAPAGAGGVAAPSLAPGQTAAPAAGGGTSRLTPMPSTASASSAIAARAKKVASGDLPLPAGRDGAAVQQYMAEHNMELPTPLTAKGQENIQRVDSVLAEIDDLTTALADIKGNPNLAIDYLQYKYLGNSTPYDSLFTKMSFEGLRSAAAALQGNGSRAYPVIKRAFEHVPNLDRLGGVNPDSLSLMRDKLKAMQKVLEDTRRTVIADERKSGVLAPIEGSPSGGGAGVPRTAEEYLQTLGR